MHKVHFQPSQHGGVNIFVDGHWMKYTDAFEFKIDKDGYYKLTLSLTVKPNRTGINRISIILSI